MKRRLAQANVAHGKGLAAAVEAEGGGSKLSAAARAVLAVRVSRSGHSPVLGAARWLGPDPPSQAEVRSSRHPGSPSARGRSGWRLSRWAPQQKRRAAAAE
nr:hypothetical protein GCM10020063_074060 [Dactylosporangium thailandense]